VVSYGFALHLTCACAGCGHSYSLERAEGAHRLTTTAVTERQRRHLVECARQCPACLSTRLVVTVEF